MNLSNARELKTQVLARAQRRAPGPPTHFLLRARNAPRDERDIQFEDPAPVAAVGVAPSERGDYKLAIRLFRGQERHGDQLLRGLGRHMNEIDLVTGVRYAPRLTVNPGGSCGHFLIGAGTLGGFVEDDDNYYILSNNHVIANSNFCFQGDPILQPGPADAGGTGLTTIAKLHRWYPMSRVDRSGVDAAIGVFDEAVDSFRPWDYTGIGQIKKSPTSNKFSVSRVVKRGRTTGVTNGTVSAFELDGVTIDYGKPTSPAIVTFDDQIEIVGRTLTKPFSQPGDSGSFIIDQDTLEVYALLYGGGRDGSGVDRTLAHFMPDVLRAMKVKLVQ